MKIEEIERPERIEIITSAQLTIPSKDFEEIPEVMEMTVLIEIPRIKDKDNVSPLKILYEARYSSFVTRTFLFARSRGRSE